MCRLGASKRQSVARKSAANAAFYCPSVQQDARFDETSFESAFHLPKVLCSTGQAVDVLGHWQAACRRATLSSLVQQASAGDLNDTLVVLDCASGAHTQAETSAGIVEPLSVKPGCLWRAFEVQACTVCHWVCVGRADSGRKLVPGCWTPMASAGQQSRN